MNRAPFCVARRHLWRSREDIAEHCYWRTINECERFVPGDFLRSYFIKKLQSSTRHSVSRRVRDLFALQRNRFQNVDRFHLRQVRFLLHNFDVLVLLQREEELISVRAEQGAEGRSDPINLKKGRLKNDYRR